VGASSANGATISYQRVGSGPVNPGTTVRIDTFINDITTPGDALRGYQITATVTPQAGSTGTVSLAPDSLSGVFECVGGSADGGPCTMANSAANCPGGTCSGPNFIDDSRLDWVYSSLPAGSAITASVPNQPTFAATLLDPVRSQQMSTPKYLGTLIFQASATALGNFQIGLNASTDYTFLIDQESFETLIPYTFTPLTITVAVAPLNDSCNNATLVFDGTTAFSTQNTSTDGPNHAGGPCDSGDGGIIANDVWFNYTTSCSGILTLSTCGAATFDTRLAVYNGLTCPVTTGNLLACSDNGSGCTGATSKITMPSVTQGTPMKIRIGAPTGISGTGDLTIACVPNDTCATARAVSIPSSTNGATIGASVDSGLPACTVTVTSPGVWYSVTGTGGVMTASLCGAASYDTRLTVFSGATCGALVCVAGANNTCGSRESVAWCSTLGANYFVLVHGSGAEGTFTLAMSTVSCNDANACTTDSCSAGVCGNTPNYAVGTVCCNPSNAATTPINDNNPCTTDSCNVSNGQVSHTPVPNGLNVACDDTFGCTVDECFNGACRNTDVEDLNIPCSNDSQCPGDSVCGPGRCVCGSAIELVALPGGLPTQSCHAIGDQLVVRVEMAFVSADTPIVGSQFFLAYDASTLDFISIEPGNDIQPSSPFSLEFAEQVNEVAGTIDYVVSVPLGQPGVIVPATLAVITFDVIAECDPFVRFRPSGPNGIPNRFSATGGVEVIPGDLVSLETLQSADLPPALSGCPASISTVPDAGAYSAIVNFGSPTANDSCDGALPVTCNPPSGSNFSSGVTTQVTCQATNSCGLVGSCAFNVTVQPIKLTTTVQLSPTMSNGPFSRCLTFDVWDCDAPGGPQRHSVVQQNMTFNSGWTSSAEVTLPGGGWDCISVRDKLHTLRSTAANFSTVDNINYTASFSGSRSGGGWGHWMLGGNLNDDNFIDILDFGVFVSEFLTPGVPNSPCGTVAPDGNINGDNVIDLVDFVFVQVNSLQAGEPTCCPSPIASGEPEEAPVESISVRELQRRGLYHLIMADLNRDGILDQADMEEFANGTMPSPEFLPPKQQQGTERPKTLRELRQRPGE